MLLSQRKTMQNIEMAIVEFSLDNTDYKFADLYENRNSDSFQAINWPKNNFDEIHRARWTLRFPALTRSIILSWLTFN